MLLKQNTGSNIYTVIELYNENETTDIKVDDKIIVIEEKLKKVNDTQFVLENVKDIIAKVN